MKNFGTVPVSDTYKEKTEEENWITQSTGGIFFKGQRVGSGFNIGNGYFLTAGHCCINDYFNMAVGTELFGVNFENGFFNQQFYKINRVIIARNDAEIDFAILQLEENPENCVQLCYDEPYGIHQLSQAVVIAHHPEGGDMKVSKGIITLIDNDTNSKSVFDKASLFRYTPSTMPGSSGAPIGLVEKKLVLGVHAEGDKDFQGYHAATSIKAIQEYLCKHTHYSLKTLTNAPDNNATQTQQVPASSGRDIDVESFLKGLGPGRT
jgi:hypothetical protein